jgi:hypothetical protein
MHHNNNITTFEVVMYYVWLDAAGSISKKQEEAKLGS